jgi:hypothetical protein
MHDEPARSLVFDKVGYHTPEPAERQRDQHACRDTVGEAKRSRKVARSRSSFRRRQQPGGAVELGAQRSTSRPFSTVS